jgi:hypothetical protein
MSETTHVRFSVLGVSCRWCNARLALQMPEGLQPGEALAFCEREAEKHMCPERIAVHVVSTGFAAPTKEKCLASVASQKGVLVRHYYVEASTQEPPQEVITNQMLVIRMLPPDAVVVLLDGDDWLAHDDVLARVKEMHDAGAWVTYGSFRYDDGRRGFAAPYLATETVRSALWRATHLKTIRAGLFQRLRLEDQAWPSGAPVPWDMVTMFAAIEQAGWDRTVFCPDVLSIYSFATSHEWRAGNRGREDERSIEADIRARPPYARVEGL